MKKDIITILLVFLPKILRNEYASVYIEIEYNCEEETDQKAVSVTALNLIEN